MIEPKLSLGRESIRVEAPFQISSKNASATLQNSVDVIMSATWWLLARSQRIVSGRKAAAVHFKEIFPQSAVSSSVIVIAIDSG
jgi:hypothetical protein